MIEDTLYSALCDIGLPVEPEEYTGTDDNYITYNFIDVPVDYGDNKPYHVRRCATITLTLSNGVNPRSYKNAVIDAVLRCGMTYPDVEPLGSIRADGGGGRRQWAFDSEAVEEAYDGD